MKKPRKRKFVKKRRSTSKKKSQPPRPNVSRRGALGRKVDTKSTGKDRPVVAKLHLLKDFHYIELPNYAKDLERLEEAPNSVVVFGDAKKASIKFYLSSLESIRKTLQKIQKRQPKSQMDRTLECAVQLRQSAHLCRPLEAFNT